VSATLRPHLDLLPPSERQIWHELVAITPDFVLYDKTALALHPGHRQSVDVDFFGSHAFEPLALKSVMPFLAEAEITQPSTNTLSVIVDRGGPVKLSFLHRPGSNP
jgi:hypothetical protein